MERLTGNYCPVVEATEKSEPGKADGLRRQVKFFEENERGIVQTSDFSSFGERTTSKRGPTVRGGST